MNAPQPCPHCGHEMKHGLFVIHGTRLGFLAFGSSREHLWFQPDDGDGYEQDLVLSSDRTSRGFRCGSCGTTVILGEAADDQMP